jgi:DNA repair protein RadD
MTTPTLRPYQRAAIDTTFDWMAANDGNPLIVLPTGAGKSLVLSAIIHDVLTQWPSERILCVTHVKELIEQNHAAALRYWPECPAGIYSAGLRKRDIDARVLFCGIQSVADKAATIGWADIVIVDEAHLIPREGMGRYRKFLDAMKSMNSQLRVIGLTATPYRTDSGLLCEGEDRVFDGVSYDADLVQLIRDGFLSRTVAKQVGHEIDTTGVRVQAGEFKSSDLEAAAMSEDAVPDAVAEIVRRGADRKAWLLFCVSVKHAMAVADELGKHGVQCAQVYGGTPSADRAEIVRAFKSRELKCIVNVNVLTTGFDAPHVDLVAILRPTCSPGLFVQMAGRGFRLAEGKTDCLLLDFGQNFRRHGPLDAIEVAGKPREDREPGEAPVKTCPSCESLVAASALECADCGHLFPPREPKHTAKADEVEAVRGLSVPKFETFRVGFREFARHSKPGKPPSMRVTYHPQTFGPTISEWICVEHDDYARRKAETWWREHGGEMPCPVTVAEALAEQHTLHETLELTVRTDKEFPEIVARKLKVEPGASEPDAGPPSGESIDYSIIPF